MGVQTITVHGQKVCAHYTPAFKRIKFFAASGSPITAELAKEIQGKLGYIVAGYGFSHFRQSNDQKVIHKAEWESSDSCE